MVVGDRATNRLDNGIAELRTVVALDLMHHHKLLDAVDLYGKRGSGARPEKRIAGFDRPLDVTRVEVATAQDDEILGPAGNK